MRRGAAILCATAVAAAAAPARAREWSWCDGGRTFELNGFYKPTATLLRFPDDLVDETAALADLATRAGLGGFEPLPEYAAVSTHVVRLWSKLALDERFSLDAGWQIAATIASDEALTGGAALGSVLAVGAAKPVSGRRLVDLDRVLAENDWLLVQHNLNLLAAHVRLPRSMEIVAGRQILSWGTGRFWNPTDLLSPFAPTDVDREVRHGVDALRFSTSLGATSLLDVLWLPQQEAADQGGVIRAQTNVKGYDLSASAAKYLSDVVLGADAAGDAGPLAVHAEAAYTLGLAGLTDGPVTVEDSFLRAVAGVDWMYGSKLVLSGEYYFNGFGASDPDGYVGKLRSDRVQRGEIFGAGRHYLAVAASYQATELLTLTTSVIANLQDPSAIVLPVLEYWAAQKIIVRAGATLPLGRTPDARPIEALTVEDLLTQSPEWTSATSSLGLRSEYGASPVSVFAEVGLYY